MSLEWISRKVTFDLEKEEKSLITQGGNYTNKVKEWNWERSVSEAIWCTLKRLYEW
jgi:hypothetical protein